MAPLAAQPSPPSNGLHLGPFFIHAYGLAYVVAVLAAVVITGRRWEAQGGSRALVHEVALWGFPAGLIGGRLYFLATHAEGHYPTDPCGLEIGGCRDSGRERRDSVVCAAVY